MEPASGQSFMLAHRVKGEKLVAFGGDEEIARG
jgi:hypothetical protein